MCGIFGILAKKGSVYTPADIRKVTEKLSILSQTRGKDSSGLCFRIEGKSEFKIVKGDIPISKLLKTREFKNQSDGSAQYQNNELVENVFIMGHARLVTNGSQLHHENNQPVIKDGIIGIHNGIIVNNEQLWNSNRNLIREFDIDTEVMLSMVRNNLSLGLTHKDAVAKVIQSCTGTVSVALTFVDSNKIIIATNNGALYILHIGKDMICFSSEYIMLKKLSKLKIFNESNKKISQVKTNTGCQICIEDLNIQNFGIGKRFIKKSNKSVSEHTIKPIFSTDVQCVGNIRNKRSILVDTDSLKTIDKYNKLESAFELKWEHIQNLKRCTKCILPETFPFINFDSEGVCNYCKNYRKRKVTKSLFHLRELVEPFKSNRGMPDVLIPFSGGRDSTYTLHIVKKELGLNPIAYTYDWGMVTDLARRNIARVCGKLGVENIIVAADIHWKRENIKKNIEAWIKKPHLGMVPLFMAGDKFFFYYADKIKKQNNINLNIWGVNYLENTDFKTGFAGIPPQFDKKNIYSLSLSRQLQLFKFVASMVGNNLKYVNQSVLDNLGSFVSRYIVPKRDYFNMFDFYEWDEKEIETLVRDEYDWELATDTKSTWRIGDGTAPFYNYIYLCVAGFCENDTFRSNQIRENMITRKQALKFIEDENKPRFKSIKWYLDIIGMDFMPTLNKINEIPILY